MRDRHDIKAAQGLLICTLLLGCGAEPKDASSTNPGTSTPPSGVGPIAGTAAPSLGNTGPNASPNTMQPMPTPAAPLAMPSTSGVIPMPAAAPVAGVTYEKDIRPVLETRCVECHGGKPEDRIGPFSLDSWETVSSAVMTYSVVGAVTEGRMPPWPAAADCRPIADDRSLSPETKALFMEWEKAGFPQGDPASYVPPEQARTAALGEPSLILTMSNAYMPRRNDEYTCFGLADDSGALYAFPERKFMVAVQVLPGVPSEVHHVQLHRTGGTPAAGPSNCSGTVGGSLENMFSWRPGSTPLVYPGESAANIPAGAGFTIQVHYNATFAVNGPQPDKTRVAFWFLEEGTPETIVQRIPVSASVNIPAGAPDVRSGSGTSVGAGVDIIGISPHAHMLATEMTAAATAGGQQHCLINIPKWDYHWQLDYMFQEPLTGPAQVSTTCRWNNTAENQPVVNGMQLQPRSVAFGEGSFDEMCLHYIWTRRAFTN